MAIDLFNECINKSVDNSLYPWVSACVCARQRRGLSLKEAAPLSSRPSHRGTDTSLVCCTSRQADLGTGVSVRFEIRRPWDRGQLEM